jgi:hypothetical protein
MTLAVGRLSSSLSDEKIVYCCRPRRSRRVCCFRLRGTLPFFPSRRGSFASSRGPLCWLRDEILVGCDRSDPSSGM